MILAIRNNWHNATFAQFTTVGFAVIALVQSQSFGAPKTFADSNTVNSCQQLSDIVAIGFAQRKVQRVSICINDQMPFQAFNTVFSRVSDLVVRPLLDLITLAS